VTTTTHKTLRGPRGGMILCKEEYAKAVDKAVFPGIQGGPLMHVIAAKAVALKEALSPAFKEYQRQVVANAKVLAETLMERGYRIVSGGTDNHLLLVDVKRAGLTGRDAERALDEVGITVNKNTIPFDTESPFVTSGIRIGTPAVTTRGMKEDAMREIAALIDETLKAAVKGVLDQKAAELKARVAALCQKVSAVLLDRGRKRLSSQAVDRTRGVLPASCGRKSPVASCHRAFAPFYPCRSSWFFRPVQLTTVTFPAAPERLPGDTAQASREERRRGAVPPAEASRGLSRAPGQGGSGRLCLEPGSPRLVRAG